jgi:hypothetical protein
MSRNVSSGALFDGTRRCWRHRATIRGSRRIAVAALGRDDELPQALVARALPAVECRRKIDAVLLGTFPARWTLEDPRGRPYLVFWTSDDGGLAYLVRMARVDHRPGRPACHLQRGERPYPEWIWNSA